MAQPCKFCQGKGVVQFNPSLPPVACPVCGGTGFEEDPGLFYVYEFTFALATNDISKQFSLNIQNYDFKWMFAMVVSTGFFTVKLSDASSNRPFSNQEVHVNNLFGTSQNPFPLLTPFTFRKKGQILAVASDLSAAPNNIRMAFAGVELSS